MTLKRCPVCKEELNLVWDEDLGQLFVCKNEHSFEFDYSKNPPHPDKTLPEDSGLPPMQ